LAKLRLFSEALQATYQKKHKMLKATMMRAHGPNLFNLLCLLLSIPFFASQALFLLRLNAHLFSFPQSSQRMLLMAHVFLGLS